MPVCHTPPRLSKKPNGVEDHNISSLLETLRMVDDPRSPQGRIHELGFLLAVAVVATLAGARNFAEIGRRAADLSQNLLERLGATWDHHTGRYLAPNESTLRRLLQDVDGDQLDMAVGAWLFERARRGPDGELVIAIDGKVLRGAWTDDNDQVTLFSAMLQGEGLVVAQTRVPDGTNEITQVRELVRKTKIVPGKTVASLDAAHTQHDTARFLRGERGIDYVLTVKGNQPTLQKAVLDRCRPLLRNEPGHVEEERGHGRVRRWSTWTADAEGIDFPYAAQVAVIRREEFTSDGVRISKEYALIVTSLPASRTGPADVHRYVKGHWGIENKVHWVRDTTWREDAGQAYTGNGPRSLASLRNLAMGMFRLNGINRIKEATERIAGDRDRALPLLATQCYCPS